MKFDFRRVFLVLLLVVAASYLWSLHGTFHFDDSHSVENNMAIRSLKNIPEIWKDAATSSMIPENRNYRPLMFTFFTFAWAAGGGATWPFHLLKLIMLTLMGLGVFAVWRRLFSEPGWLGQPLTIQLPFRREVYPLDPLLTAFALALIFVIHPAGAECAIYISSTSSLQAAMFYVWAFWSYLQFRDGQILGADAKANRRHLGLSLFLYFCSVASKEEGITLPAVVLLTEVYLGQGAVISRLRNSMRRVLPYVGLGIALTVWMYLLRSVSGGESRGEVTAWNYFMTQWRAYLWYMRTWFWPFDLNADNVTFGFSSSIREGAVIQAAIGNLLLLSVAWLLRQRFPAFLFGLLWFYITISPASSIIPLAEPVNERRMYLAYVGFAGGTLPLVFALLRWLFPEIKREVRLGWVAVLVCFGLYVGTLSRNRVWLNPENLWTDTVEKNPTSGRAQNNLALVFMGRGQYLEAIKLLETCERNWTAYAYCPINRAIALEALHRNNEAELAFQRGLQLGPRNVHANFHYAVFLEEVKKDCRAAAPYYKAAVDITGGRYPAADSRLAGCYAQLGMRDQSTTSFQRASEAEPDNDQTLFQWGFAEHRAGRLPEALTIYRRITARSPKHLQAWYNIGVAELALNHLALAREAFEKSAELDPVGEGTLLNLADVLERMHEYVGSLRVYRKLAATYPAKKGYQERIGVLESKADAAPVKN